MGVAADSKPLLLVERSGSLQFEWSLRGRAETGGGLMFSLLLPACPSNQLTLTLPAGLTPTVDSGIVTPVGGATHSTKEVDSKPQARQWQIELGGQTQCILRVDRHDFVEKARPLTLVHQTSNYEFSQSGMQLAVELKLDVFGEPVREIPLWIDAPLEVVTVRCGELQIPWLEADREAAIQASKADTVPNPSRGSTRRRIVLKFAEPLRGAVRTVRLTAVAPLQSSGDLPGIRPASESIYWQDGIAALLVAAPLEIRDLKLRGCRQTNAEPLPAPLSGEAIALQYFRPDPAIDLAIGVRPNRFNVRTGTTLDVRDTSLTATLLADISATEGESFGLEARVSPSWVIDSVDSVPSGAVAGWSREFVGKSSKLTVSLNKAVRPEQPLVLTVAGRWRRRPLGERLLGQDLNLLHFEQLNEIRRMVAIHTSPSYQLAWSGANNLTRLDSAIGCLGQRVVGRGRGRSGLRRRCNGRQSGDNHRQRGAKALWRNSY